MYVYKKKNLYPCPWNISVKLALLYKTYFLCMNKEEAINKHNAANEG